MLGKIKIKNIKTMSSDELSSEDIFYVARWSKKYQYDSPLGNRYKIGHNHDGTRNQVLKSYSKDFWEMVEKADKRDPAYLLLRRIARLVAAGEDVTLVCWCFPLKCHAEVVKEGVLKLIEDGKV